MKGKGKWKGRSGLAVAALCMVSVASAQGPDFTGTWTGEARCPVGKVAFKVDVKGRNGTLTYGGFGPRKLHAVTFPVKLTFMRQEMFLHFAGPDQGADFGSFQGSLLADGTVGTTRGLKVNGEYCEPFALSRGQAGTQPRVAKGVLDFNAKGLANEALFMKILHGDFLQINVPTDHAVFNSFYGSYLGSYARKCAASPRARPARFVQMTDLECVDQRITATYYSNGTYTESAPYCNRWADVPNGLYADPGMWEVKKKLDAVFLGDAYRNIFAFLKPGKTDPLGGVFEASPQRILAAVATGAKDMDALVTRNACDSPGLMRFQENLRLYAINRPFGIRPDGSSGAPIPIPAPGATFEDPDYVALLEDMVKGEARSWTVNKYLLGSVANPSVGSRDGKGRPQRVTAQYRFGGMRGMDTGSVTLSFFEGYPECLYFSDKPDSCRSPSREVTARYVHGGYAAQGSPGASEGKNPASDEAARESEARRKARRAIRQGTR